MILLCFPFSHCVRLKCQKRCDCKACAGIEEGKTRACGIDEACEKRADYRAEGFDGIEYTHECAALLFVLDAEGIDSLSKRVDESIEGIEHNIDYDENRES